MATRTRLTLEQFLALPDEKPHREFIHGEAAPKPMTNSDHVSLVFKISGVFTNIPGVMVAGRGRRAVFG